MKLSLVVPCYNEEAVLPKTAQLLAELMAGMIDRGKIDAESAIWLVDDGSRDATWRLIEGLARDASLFAGVKLSRNRGHQNALLAGLTLADGDAVITLDADLQDDPSVIEAMVDAHEGGCDIVYGVRRSRNQDSRFKRWTARAYYALLRRLGVDVIPDHADYRLMSRRAIDALLAHDEVNLFLRGILPQLGFDTSRVEYDRAARFAGETKYPLHKMLGLAIDGITSFSPVPLRMIAALGALVFLISTLMAIWVLGVRVLTSSAIPGWASTTLPIYVLGGMQLLCMGVVGEYVAKVYMETKRRPRFFIDRIERRSSRIATPNVHEPLLAKQTSGRADN